MTTLAPERDGVVAALERTAHARAFAPGPLPPMALRRVLEAGRLAPSLYNTQPWLFVVLRDANYEALRAGCDRGRDTFFRMLPLFARMSTSLREPGYRRGLERQRTGPTLPPHGVGIVILRDARVPESAEACACAALAMALAASEQGLASAFTSWTRALGFDKTASALLEVPRGWKIASSLVVGNPATPLTRTAKERLPLDDLVRWR